jgi:hypothetical protein
VKLALVRFTGLNAPDSAVSYYSEHLAQQVRLSGVRVITGSEITAVLGLERQRQLLSCADASTSCLAELANALGVDGLLTGSLGKFGDVWQLDVKVLAANDASTLAVHSKRVKGDEALLDELAVAARAISAQSMKKLDRPPALSVAIDAPEPERRGPSAARRWWWAPAAGGVACAGIGTFFLVQAQANLDDLKQLRPLADPAATAARGKEARAMGAAFAGVGVAAVGAAVAMLLFGDPGSQVAPTLAVGPESAGFAVTGVFP